MTEFSPELTEGRSGHFVDPERLSQWLQTHIDEFCGPVTVAQFSGGQSNPTYLLTTPTQQYVLRSKPLGVLLPSAHAIDREYRLLRALHGTTVPIADAFCYCSDTSVIGAEFYVMEYVRGRVLWESSLPGMGRSERRSIFNELGRVMAELHSVDVDAAGLRDFGKTGNYFDRQISRWTRQYRASETHPIGSLERLMEWLPVNIPARQKTTLVHGDFRIDNVIFDATEPRVLAVLDWELSTLGDPLADFSYLCLAWHLPVEGFRGLAGRSNAELEQMGIPSERDFVSQYCKRTGIEDIGAGDWYFYLAYNLFRVAAILQGVMKRALDGNASSSQALEYGERAALTADIGWTCAERAMARCAVNTDRPLNL
ncbi:Predicted kinase, aminoglycoside phosphotransferase (APT) family [Burkholderia sp. OK233]|nr:Predicted kinase, aminoglycoside phosphotransferase (APT) family [Burkholderia sp. OK233]